MNWLNSDLGGFIISEGRDNFKIILFLLPPPYLFTWQWKKFIMKLSLPPVIL